MMFSWVYVGQISIAACVMEHHRTYQSTANYAAWCLSCQTVSAAFAAEGDAARTSLTQRCTRGKSREQQEGKNCGFIRWCVVLLWGTCNGKHLGRVEVKASPSDGASELCVGLFLCSPGNLGDVLVSSPLTESCFLWSILLCSGPVELVARLEEGCRSPGMEQSKGGPSPLCRHMASLVAYIPASSASPTPVPAARTLPHAPAREMWRRKC